jgi:hypothetical protein
MTMEEKLQGVKPYYEQMKVNNKQAFKKHVLETTVAEEIPMNRRLPRKFTFVSIPLVGLALVGFTVLYHGPTFNGRPVPPSPPLTRNQIDKVFNNISEITTPNGKYIRTNQFVQLPTDQIAYNKTDILKPGIKEVVLPYGIFIKTDLRG